MIVLGIYQEERAPDITSVALPWWVRAIYLLGVPAAISVYLIWLIASQLNVRMDYISDTLRQHTADSAYNVQAKVIEQQQLNDIYRMLQQICLRQSRTLEERENCVRLR